jgi:dienelactone hydrolase
MIIRRLILALVTLLLIDPAKAEEQQLTVTPPGWSINLPALLIKPEGDGPFPAIVMLHDCSGLGPRGSGAPRRWANELVPQGYVVLIPDSFTPRGLPNGTCTAPFEYFVAASPYIRAVDAYGALALLRTLPFVDPQRIGVMGGSHGGSTVLAALTALEDAAEPLAETRRKGFTAALALYPGCAFRLGGWNAIRDPLETHRITGYKGAYRPLAPLLILTGALDDWTPAEPCRALVESARAAGKQADIVIYPDAHHSFDNTSSVRYVAERNNGSVAGGKGATTGGNVKAWADAKLQVQAFFAKHLKAAP